MPTRSRNRILPPLMYLNCINGENSPGLFEQNDLAVQRDAFMQQVGEETQGIG